MQPHVGMNLLQNLHHFCMFLFQLRALRHLSTHPRNPASTNLHWLSIFLASPSLMVYRPRPVAATLHAVTLLVILFLADDISDSQSLCVVPTLHPVSKTNSQICGSQRQQTRLLFDLDSEAAFRGALVETNGALSPIELFATHEAYERDLLAGAVLRVNLKSRLRMLSPQRCRTRSRSTPRMRRTSSQRDHPTSLDVCAPASWPPTWRPPSAPVNPAKKTKTEKTNDPVPVCSLSTDKN